MNIQPQPPHASPDNQPIGFLPRGLLPTPGRGIIYGPNSQYNYHQMYRYHHHGSQPPVTLMTPPNSDYLIDPNGNPLSESKLNSDQPVVWSPITAVTPNGTFTFLTPPERQHQIADRAAYLFGTQSLNPTQLVQTTDLNHNIKVNGYGPAPVPVEMTEETKYWTGGPSPPDQYHEPRMNLHNTQSNSFNNNYPGHSPKDSLSGSTTGSLSPQSGVLMMPTIEINTPKHSQTSITNHPLAGATTTPRNNGTSIGDSVAASVSPSMSVQKLAATTEGSLPPGMYAVRERNASPFAPSPYGGNAHLGCFPIPFNSTEELWPCAGSNTPSIDLGAPLDRNFHRRRCVTEEERREYYLKRQVQERQQAQLRAEQQAEQQAQQQAEEQAQELARQEAQHQAEQQAQQQEQPLQQQKSQEQQQPLQQQPQQ